MFVILRDNLKILTMKLLQLLSIFFLCIAVSYGQNQSETAVSPSITDQQFTGSFPIAPEIFRFKSGLVTQLDLESPTNDTLFNFSDSRWFSIGRLQTSANQTVYGLRFQLPNKALTYGYQDIDDENPRIQWIGTGEDLGNLEFRVANSFSSTNSTLVAEMTSSGSTVFGDSFFIAPEAKVQITNENGEGVGLYAEAFSVDQGTAISANSFNNDINIGVRGRVGNNVSALDFAYGIFGVATQNSFGNSYAGFFDGDVHVDGTFTHTSDRKLKENLTKTEDVLSKLSQLNSYTYTFKANKNLNLPMGLQHGLVAQELEEVYPELVSQVVYPIYNEKQEIISTATYKSVNYIGLISELTAAINELNAKVKDLEGQLETKVVYKSNFSSQELDKINKNSYQLEQNTPNPFSESTIISYALPEDQNKASILIFDLNGRLVNSYDLTQNRGELKINATDLNGAGMYLYTLSTNGEEIITKRMILK